MEISYLYPPRPEYKISVASLETYDKGEYFAQPKLNGSCAVLYLDGSGYEIYNRHGEKLSLHKDLNFTSLHKNSGLMVLVGEYMNKNKKDASGASFNHKFVIFDILTWKGIPLIGTRLEYRVNLLEKFYPCENERLTEGGVEYDTYLCQTQFKDIYKVPNFLFDFTELYHRIIKIDMYGGLVLKRKTAILNPCTAGSANKLWQIKCSKDTKNYTF